MANRSEIQEIAERAMEHVGRLCGFGTRALGSTAESRTLEYLTGYLTDCGFSVRREPLSFARFLTHDRNLLLNGCPCFFRSALVAGELPASGRCTVLNSKNPIPERLAERIVITDDLNSILHLGHRGSSAAIVTRSEDLEDLRWADGTDLRLEIPGETSKEFVTSFNLIADSQTLSPKQLLLAAHWDSRDGPGAADNASGVALAMELLRWSAASPPSVSLVLTSAEESGLLGALSHVMRNVPHSDTIRGVLNTDGVVGTSPGGCPYLSMLPPDAGWLSSQEVDRTPEMHLIRLEDIRLSWYVSGSDVYWSSPTVDDPALRDAVMARLAAAELAWEEGGCCSGTDDRAFAFIGLPTVQQGFHGDSEGNVQHSQSDTPKPHFKADLVRSAQVSMAILDSLAESHDPERRD